MPFEIVRNDIVQMRVDAVVNTANPKPVIGYGVDSAIHQKAGPALLAARRDIGRIPVGEAAITPGFDLPAKYVIHAVTPEWQGGERGEAALLRSCYEKALELAKQRRCASVAFPLLAAGNHGFPKTLSLQIAVEVFSRFLLREEMNICLVVFSREAVQLSEKLVRSVASFIDERYIRAKHIAEYGVVNKREIHEEELQDLRDEMLAFPPPVAGAARLSEPSPADRQERKLEDLLREVDETFSQSVLRHIDRKGLTDPEVYKRANLDRKLFSKIRGNPDYRPSKATALALAIALELNLDETRDLIGRAGYALSRSSRVDIIIEFFIVHQDYDIFKLNEVLFAFGLPCIGSSSM